MDRIETTIEDILQGNPIPLNTEDSIDLTLAEQIDELDLFPVPRHRRSSLVEAAPQKRPLSLADKGEEINDSKKRPEVRQSPGGVTSLEDSKCTPSSSPDLPRLPPSKPSPSPTPSTTQNSQMASLNTTSLTPVPRSVDSIASKGIENLKISSSQFKPVVQKTVAYIVAAVIFNEQNEVLMMQEAKSSYAGTWYLPAGRMEPGETIVEGVKREVLEETGLTFDPTTLLLVECAQGHWFRFVLTGRITGGELKTVARADAESLQASWVADVELLSLRARDIVPVIERALGYQALAEHARHPPLLPVFSSHSKLLLRLLILIKKKSNNKAHVLVSEKGCAHLPVVEINPNKSLHSLIKRYMQSLFGSELPTHKPAGVLGVEHAPGENRDGLCLTILVSCRDPLESFTLSGPHTWLELSSSLGGNLVEKTGKNLSVALHVIH